MKHIGTAAAVFLLAALPPALAQQSESREVTREKLRNLLQSAGARPDVNLTFRQSEKQPYNFIAVMREGMTNADSLEIVIRVTDHDTIGFRVYPHYNGGYINLDKAKDAPELMRRMLLFTDTNFLFWGVDQTRDAFCGYTFTLESGFPENAIVTVIRSIRGTDKFVGELRPFIDGSAKAERK